MDNSLFTFIKISNKSFHLLELSDIIDIFNLAT